MHATAHLLISFALLALAGLLWLWQPAPFVWTPPDASRLAGAGLTVTTYIALCIALLWHRRRPTTSRADVTLVYASQSGSAERLARQTAQALHSPQCLTRVLALEQFEPALISTSMRWLFVVSTTGEGDPPDHALAFARDRMHQSADLSDLSYGLLALGDSSYPHYCAFGRSLDAWLHINKATALFPRIEVDNHDADDLAQWQQAIARALARPALNWADDNATTWQLQAREHLNPGSPGGAIFRLALTTDDPAMLSWQAGDIAEIAVPGSNPKNAHKREYSIASIATTGRLELLVRQMWDENGKLGLGSQYLTQQLQLGDSVRLRIRENRNFHPPAHSAPLILIGNGTGLAGLRAHLHARQHNQAHCNWLLFGERSRKHDRLFGPELDDAVTHGQLAHLDLTFSREGEALRYVQDALLAKRDEVRHWIDQGACIYVCGSSHGMAPGVSAALTEILGQSRLHALRESGRYRSDVY